MADGIELNAGSGGAVLSTDDIASVHYQIVKLALGALDSATLATGGNGNVDAGTLRVTVAADSTGVLSVDDNGSTLSIDDGGGAITVDGTVAVTGTVDLGATDNAVLDAIAASVAAIDTDTSTIIDHVDGLEGLLTTIDTDTGNIATAVQLLDDTVQVLGTDTYSEATSKGITLGAVRRDADTTLVNTTNEFGPLQMDANGRLKVEAFSGEALPVTLTSTTITGTVAVTQSGTWDEVGINDSGNSITVDNGGTFATQVDGAALTALQLIDDIVHVDDTATHATGTTKGALIMAAATPTDGSVNANDIGAVAMTTDRKLHVAVMDALPAGTAAIGKLAANSGVDIGDVDVTSIAAGTNLIGDVGIQPRATNGLSTMNATSSDGATALTNSAQVIKASAGKLYGYYIYNPNASAAFVQFYNTAAASVTVGTTNPLFMLTVPASSAANLLNDIGIGFSNAGWSWAATSTAGGNGALGTALDAVAWYA